MMTRTKSIQNILITFLTLRKKTEYKELMSKKQKKVGIFKPLFRNINGLSYLKTLWLAGMASNGYLLKNVLQSAKQLILNVKLTKKLKK